jgi:hypothetical protein
MEEIVSEEQEFEPPVVPVIEVLAPYVTMEEAIAAAEEAKG